MMSARLMSLLVTGGVVLLGFPYGAPAVAASAANSINPSGLLQGAAFEAIGDNSTVIRLSLPSYSGTPRVQVLNRPNRVVVDLVGVTRGALPTRPEVGGWSSPLVRKVRLAQFSAAPSPITRLVLEVADGVRVDVTSRDAGIDVIATSGEGSVQAKVVPSQLETSPSRVIHQAENITITPSLATTVSTAVISETLSSKEIASKAVSGDLVPSLSQTLPSDKPVALPLLLPSVLTLAQEKPQGAPIAKKEEGRGRTLGDVQDRYSGSRITIDVKGAELATFLRIIADHAKLNLVADQDVQGIYDFKFTDTPWDQVLDIIVKHAGLGMEINNGVIRVAKTEKLQKEEDDRKKLLEARALAGDLVTITRPLSFAKATEAKNIVEKMLTKRGALIVDERTNVLIISDLAKNLPLIDDLIQQLDVQVQQVQIEARVVEASGNYEKAFGVKWPTSNAGSAKLTVGDKDATWGAFNSPSWNSINSRPTGSTAWAGSYGVNTGIAGSAGDLWISFLSNRLSVNVILQALEKEGKIRIVSNPKVVTQNNKKATILSGAKIPYPTQQASSGAITVAFADANLQLDVTPQITNDGTIIMDLKIEKAEADFSAAVNGTPSILRKYIETQVLVRDGGTAVLGGIYTTTTNANTVGVPYLRKLPVLGHLFRSKTDKENNSELLIFITPRILKL